LEGTVAELVWDILQASRRDDGRLNLQLRGTVAEGNLHEFISDLASHLWSFRRASALATRLEGLALHPDMRRFRTAVTTKGW
jgi:hypothetical protein